MSFWLSNWWQYQNIAKEYYWFFSISSFIVIMILFTLVSWFKSIKWRDLKIQSSDDKFHNGCHGHFRSSYCNFEGENQTVYSFLSYLWSYNWGKQTHWSCASLGLVFEYMIVVSEKKLVQLWCKIVYHMTLIHIKIKSNKLVI